MCSTAPPRCPPCPAALAADRAVDVRCKAVRLSWRQERLQTDSCEHTAALPISQPRTMGAAWEWAAQG